MGFKSKTYASTYLYSKKAENNASAEQSLITYIMKAGRINKESAAMSQVLNMVKERQKTAVLYRVLVHPDTVLCISNDKELPASFKVFCAKDIHPVYGNNKPRIFIDCTGLITEKNGYFSCNKIDVLCAYLFDAVGTGIYYKDPNKILNNNTICRLSATCYTRMFTAVLDSLRVINYLENKEKINYITSVFFLFNVLGKDMETAQVMASSLLSLNRKDTQAWDIYYQEENFNDINTFITFLAETFKLKGLDTGVYMNKWITMFGKGSMYGVELYPAFLSTLINAYSGAYINRQNIIENICGRDMVTLCENVLRVGASVYTEGFKYERKLRGDLFVDNNK